MSTEALVPAPPYPVDGQGPYTVPHPYAGGDLIVTVNADGALTTLTEGEDWTVAPAASETGGAVTLSEAAAIAHDGAILTIVRDTALEQGWAPVYPREAGLAAQLDRIVRAAQDIRAASVRALRLPVGSGIDAELPTLTPGTTLMVNETGTGFTAGPDLADIALAAAGAAELLEALDDIDLNGLVPQSSASDATAGRLLRVGAFGLGGPALATANFDTLTVGGLYANAATDATGAPTTAAGWQVLFSPRDADTAVQLAILGGSDDLRFRRKAAGVWSTWRAVVLSGQEALPSGVILMWSGSVASIPEGFVLCDGDNDTPDLRDRFVVGAGGAYAVDATGGSADAVVVEHTHTGTASSAGAHTHNVPQGPTGESTNRITTGPTSGSANTATSSNGAHTHDLSIASAGESGTGKNLPPYYALAYIMKE
jgi:hypothetical protein